ncbi:MAG TPA: AtpZ/AtpI family protein [Planctomycetota bacterium]|nr:AtpZ/AtpI family protein [Planctomycetota bacterium]
MTRKLSPLQYADPTGFPMLSDPSFMRSMGAIVGIGWVLVAGILLGYLAGSFLDARLNTTPWLLVTGVTLGAAAGFRHVWVVSKRSLK